MAAKDQGDLLLVMAHIGCLLAHLRHQHGVAGGVEIGERAEVVGDLVAEDEPERPHGLTFTQQKGGARSPAFKQPETGVESVADALADLDALAEAVDAALYDHPALFLFLLDDRPGADGVPPPGDTRRADRRRGGRAGRSRCRPEPCAGTAALTATPARRSGRSRGDQETL
jgi:hypothetical protein